MSEVIAASGYCYLSQDEGHIIAGLRAVNQQGRGDVYVDIYDTAWNLQETIEVTRANTEFFNAQRPWIQIYGDTMIVSYDVGRDSQDFLDLQCVATVYTR